MKVSECQKIPGIFKVEMFHHTDLRGEFTKNWHSPSMNELPFSFDIKEGFYTSSKKDVIRGMHFQVGPYAHHKMVMVTHGQIQDVVLDLRKNSPTFGQSQSYTLSSDDPLALIIPIGFAHGFASQSDNSIVQYFVSKEHNSEFDRGILWSSLDFDWNIDSPIVSERDQGHPLLSDFDSPFELSSL
tara:strand:+ start:82 stop:636 length:555 start_codon:yes stop_codon:yes gene_type:complete